MLFGIIKTLHECLGNKIYFPRKIKFLSGVALGKFECSGEGGVSSYFPHHNAINVYSWLLLWKGLKNTFLHQILIYMQKHDCTRNKNYLKKKNEWFSSSRNSLQRRITINLSNRTSCTFAIFFYSMAWMGHHTINVWFWEVMDSWSSTDAWSIGHCTCYKPYDRKSYFIIKILQSSKWIQVWKFYFVLPKYQRRSIWPLNRDDNLRWLVYSYLGLPPPPFYARNFF